MIPNGKDQVLLTGDKEEIWEEERERGGNRGRDHSGGAWTDRSVIQILGYLGMSFKFFPWVYYLLSF